MSVSGNSLGFVKAVPWRPDPAGGWAELVEFGIRLGVMVCFLVNIGVTLAIGRRSLDLADGRTQWGVALMGVAAVVMLTATITWRRLAELSVLAAALFSAGLLLAGPQTRQSIDLADSWWPTQGLIATTAFLAVATRYGWALGLGVLAVNFQVRWNTWLADPDIPSLHRSVEAVASTGQLVALAGAPALTAMLVRRAAQKVDDAAALRAAERADAAAREAKARREKEADLFVHDEILRTLQMIAMGGAGVSPTAAQEAAHALVAAPLGAAEEDPEREQTQESLLGPVLRASRVEVRYRGPDVLLVPGPVQEAFRRASAEALRNVAQHSGVKSADVTVGMRGLVVGVQIRDRGVGFEPGVTHRRGLSASIQARMTDVGGSASVTSAPGEGTVVDLTWSPWPRRAAWTEGKAGILPDLFPYLVVMAAPLLLLGLWFPPLLDRHLARSGPTAFGSVLVGLVGIAYLLRGLRHRTSGMFTAALVVLSWTAVGINAWALPGGSAHARLFWMPGVVSGAVALVTIYRRSIEGAIMALGVVVIAWIGSSARVPDGADWLPYLAPTATPILCLLVTLVVRWVGERLGWEVLRLSEESEADTNAPPLEATLAQRLSGARVRLDRLLRQAAAAPVDDPRIRATATELEAEIRERLMLGADHRLIGAIARVREAGWTVRLRVAVGLPPQGAQLLTSSLEALGRKAIARPSPDESAAPSRRLLGTLDITGLPASSGWRLSLLMSPGPPPEVMAAMIATGEWGVTGDWGDVQLRVTLPAAPPSGIGATFSQPTLTKGLPV